MKFSILVNNGYRYEFECVIEAASVADARRIWKLRGDWKTDDFRVSRKVV